MDNKSSDILKARPPRHFWLHEKSSSVINTLTIVLQIFVQRGEGPMLERNVVVDFFLME